MKNILITSGGTSENIDKVRKITNRSSGKLGSMIANEIIDKYNFDNIYYVCNKEAQKPKEHKKVSIINITDVESLDKTITRLIKENNIDCVIHSMAVSDYTLNYVTNSELLINKLQNKDKKTIENIFNSKKISINSNNKISSNEKDLILVLKQTPKIISKIKKINTKLILVGFKLVVNKNNTEMLEIANNLLIKNNCDYVVANDLSGISNSNHNAIIIDKYNNKIQCETKKQIAEELVKKLFS